MSDASEWDGDWYAVISETERRELEDELAQELCSGHVLYGARLVAMGRRWQRDDVLFRLDDGRYAQVHLTRHKESNPAFPTTDIYASFDEWKVLPLEDR